MSRLVSAIIGNPMIIIWIALAGFVAGIGVGGSAAWWFQGLRVAHAQNETAKIKGEFEAFKIDLKRQEVENAEKAQQESAKNGDDFRRLKNELEKQIQDGEVFKRCVAAGKCGARVVRVQSCNTGCSSAGIAPRPGANAIGTDSVPLAGGSTEEGCQALANDAAKTTLILNKLQERIESQPGY